MMGAKTLESQIAVGTVKVAGDVSILKKFGSTMVEFDPRFEIIPGTKPPGTDIERADPYEVVPGKPIAG